MAWSIKKRTVEYIIYLLFWSVLLLSPLFGAFIKYALQKDGTFLPTVDELVAFWKFLLPAFILFFINNNILMPSLLYKKEGRLLVLYLLCVTVVSTIVFISFPVDEPLLGIPDFPESDFFPPLYDAPPIDVVEQPLPLPYFGEQGVWMFLSHPKNVRIMLVLFVLVFNICVRLFFFTIRRDEHFKELEKEKLRSELEYLKYQINPHFFMNSLNNIHALIDIDKEKAQGAVREMSKLMRYVLYDKASMFIPLEKEIQFLESYVDLMRLRYTEKLEIKVFFASDVQDVYVPSLLFMQFVENAFKHGVTYKKQSFIEISLTVDEANEIVLFTCRNTLPDAGVKTAISAAGGIGVENAKKRLGLLFGDKACLNIDNTGEWYNVELKIPIQNDQVYNC
ncbi:MAG: sensor histidine kinase [Bacteroidaceae bacterium]|nr:sensor histidine kinase [Bacteroidaceae bacterium]